MNKELKEYLKDFWRDGEGTTAEDWYSFITENYKEDEGQVIALAFDELGTIEFIKFTALLKLDIFIDYRRNVIANGIAQAFDIAHDSSSYILERALANYTRKDYKDELEQEKWDECDPQGVMDEYENKSINRRVL